MKNEISVLFTSTSAADETVLRALLARQDGGDSIRVQTASTAQQFFDAVYSEDAFHVIVVDDREVWSDWQQIIAICSDHRPNALTVLMVSGDSTVAQCETKLEKKAIVVYPRNSAGLLALSGLVCKLAAQRRNFSLRGGKAGKPANGNNARSDEREQLIYAVSHDLQDPLQLARRYATMLNEDFDSTLGDAGGKLLGHLQFNLDRTQEMLDELLDFSRLENAEPDRQPVDFGALLDDVTSLFRLTLDEIGGTIRQQEALPTLLVDQRQFQRVFQNLIGNAIRFRSERPLRVTVRAQRIRNEWRIGVKDNGIGIAEEHLQRVFGMFERVGTGDDHPGTGMGLAICKRIIGNHGGRIWARSSAGGGSVFIFSVPQGDDVATGSRP